MQRAKVFPSFTLTSACPAASSELQVWLFMSLLMANGFIKLHCIVNIIPKLKPATHIIYKVR